MDSLSEVGLDHGWKLVKYNHVDSTNRALYDLAKSGSDEGLCISALHQTAGRGRLGRTWTDVPGASILFSVLLRPRFGVEDYFAVPCALSLALRDTLEDFGVSSKIKWPNDLLIQDKKIAGILSEIGDVSSSKFLVVGLGVNLNQSAHHLVELSRKATSIRVELGTEVSDVQANSLLMSMISRFQKSYLELQGNFGDFILPMVSNYEKYCATLGKSVLVELNDRSTIQGTAISITQQGQLILEVGSTTRIISAGEVFHLHTSSE